MAIVLAWLGFATTVALLQRGSTRIAFLEAAVIQGVLVVISTEFLSLGRSLHFGPVAAFWITVIAINCFLFFKEKDALEAGWRAEVARWRATWAEKSWRSRLTFATIALICLITLTIALLDPPNNYDGMTYHLPRIAHWLQNRSVNHYPTHNLRQISFSPGASYFLAHWQLLASSDRFVNTLQWSAGLGCILSVSLLARYLIGPEAQLMGALLCATLPMAILQSATPQTDLLTAFWLTCTTVFVLRRQSYTWGDGFWLGAAASLAIVTKPTSYLFGFPLFGLLAYRQYRHSAKPLPTLAYLLAIASSSLILTIPSYWRNWQTFGTPLGIDTDTRNTIISIAGLVSNSLRNLALSFPLSGFWAGIEHLHSLLGIDVNDPAFSFTGGRSFQARGVEMLLIPDEDYVSNPLHALLILLGAIAITRALFRKLGPHPRTLAALGIANLTGFLLFSGLLKWQAWNNRLLLPLLILSLPLAVYLLHILSVGMRQAIAILLILNALLYSLSPVHRPLIPLFSGFTPTASPTSIVTVPRSDRYFSGAGRSFAPVYNSLRDLLIQNKCQTVGLDLHSNDWEYPLWVLPQQAGLTNLRLQHINVKNVSGKLPPEFPPSEMCAIIQHQGNTINYLQIVP